MECGATCLRMIAKFHGKEYSAATMQNLCVVTREGVSMLGIADAGVYRISYDMWTNDLGEDGGATSLPLYPPLEPRSFCRII